MEWLNTTLDTFLVKINFITTQANPCLYTLHNHSACTNSNARPYDPKLHQLFMHTLTDRKPLIILSVYVDNLLVVGMPADIKMVKEQL